MMRGRWPIALMLIVALLASGAMQTIARRRHDQLVPRTTASRLSGIDTFTLGLVLGGLRGPLVMVLWTSTENQKTDRDMEDIDTKLNLIRMLEPDFDSVFIYQEWNKAYNLSAMMAGIPNKYSCVLGAIKMGREADAERQGNVSILAEIGSLYFEKLGHAAEHEQYEAFMRHDTFPHRIVRLSNPNADPVEHDVVLDENGMILPEFLQPRNKPLSNAPDAYNGAELQYLARYSTPEMGGFRYGMPPRAMGFNYYRRAAQIMHETGREHAQLSKSVIDSRPAVCLKLWAESEMERARRLEIAAALGEKLAGAEGPELELAAANVPMNGAFVDKTSDAMAKANEAIFGFRRAGQVARHAFEEYDRHMSSAGFAFSTNDFRPHVAALKALEAMAEADHDYLAAKAALSSGGGPADVSALVGRARAQYREAWRLYYLLMLRFYVPDEVAGEFYSQGAEHHVDKSNIEAENPQRYPQLIDRVRKHYANIWYGQRDEIEQFTAAAGRAEQRIQQLDAYIATSPAPTTAPGR